MGAKASKPAWLGKGHSALFYKGSDAAVVGRYTLSEAYYYQAIERHPGHAFWKELAETMMHPPSVRRKSSAVPLEGIAEEDSATPSLASGELRRRIVLPTDKQLTDILDYLRLVSDIALVYGRQANYTEDASADFARRLGMSYAAYAVVRVQVLVDLLVIFIIRRGELKAKGGDVAVRISTPLDSGDQTITPSGKKVEGSDCVYLAADEMRLLTFCQSCHYYFFSNLIAYNYEAMVFLCRSGSSVTSDKRRSALLQSIMVSLEIMEHRFVQFIQGLTNFHLPAMMERFLCTMRKFRGPPSLSREVDSILRHYCSDIWSACNGNASSCGTAATSRYRPDVLFRSLGGPTHTIFSHVEQLDLATLPLVPMTVLLSVDLEVLDPVRPNALPPLQLLTDRDAFCYISPLPRTMIGREPVQLIPGRNSFLLKCCGMPQPFRIHDWFTYLFVTMEEKSAFLLVVSMLKTKFLMLKNMRSQAEELSKATFEFSLSLHGGGSETSKIVVELLQKVFNK